MSNFQQIKFDDTSIVKSSEARSICEHLEAFIRKNMKTITPSRTKAEEVLFELSMWINRSIRDDQLLREKEIEEQEKKAKEAYDKAQKKPAKKAKKKCVKKKGG